MSTNDEVQNSQVEAPGPHPAELVRFVLNLPGLTRAEKLVLIALAMHCDWLTGKHAYPGTATLCNLVGVTKNGLRRVLDRLETQPGLLEKVHDGKWRGQAAEYDLPWVKGLPDLALSLKGLPGKGLSTSEKGLPQLPPSVQRSVQERKNNTSPPKPGGGVAALFDRFWEAYPKKQKKLEARRAWAKIAEGDLPGLRTGLRAWMQCEQWQRDGGKYIPDASRFLRNRHWEEPPEAVKKPCPRELVVPGPATDWK